MRRIIRYALPLVAAMALGFTGPGGAGAARAGEASVVLVELFTSQGCNSCPPADALLGDLASRDDVLGLSLHVDYWDYLGWRDTFALKAATKRQYAYRDAWSSRYVYTPQMVVAGHVEVRGARAGELERAIMGARKAGDAASITLAAEGDAVRATVTGAPDGAEIWAARYSFAETVEIERGENAGKTITYHNVVSALENHGRAGRLGAEGLSLAGPGPGEGLAVWVQEPDGGRILGATRVAPGS